MSTIVKLLVAASIAFGFHYGVRHLINAAATAQLGDRPPWPAATKIEVDPETMHRALAVERAAQPTAAQRAVIEDAERRIDQLNRETKSAAPMPPRFPALPRQ